MISIVSTGNEMGHADLASRVVGTKLATIKDNTHAGGSPEGIGICRRTIANIDRGFIDFPA